MTEASSQEITPPPPRVSVVVVSHNRKARLEQCLESLERCQERQSLQIVVVENGSQDGSAELEARFPGIRFAKLPKNFGLTKALNIGWRAADAAYVLFLHEDTEIAPDVPSRLADVLDSNSDAAAACPLLVDGDGAPAPQLGVLPPDGTFQPATAVDTETIAVQYPLGAALMMRVYMIKAMRQIDERYGQFGSDAELAAQILRASKKILLVPAARVRHHGRQQDPPARRADFRLGRAVFLRKYKGFGAGLAARLGAVFEPLLAFRLGEVRYTLSGEKIDGKQS